MSRARKNPSAAYTRFKQSMLLDYDAWRDGRSYAIDALADITDEERTLLTQELCARGALDWRDVEALRALATPVALLRLAHLEGGQGEGGEAPRGGAGAPHRGGLH